MLAMNSHQRFLTVGSIWVAYVLHMLVITAPIGALINALCLRGYKRHWCEPGARQDDAFLYVTSHHQWMLTTFIVVIFMAMVTVGTLGSGIGVLVGVAAVCWWLYRVVKGMAEFAHQRSLPLAVEWRCDTGMAV